MDNIQIVIFDEEELTGTLVESYSKELVFPCVFEKYGKFSPECVKDDNEPKILLINIENAESKIIDKMTAFNESKNIKIIAMSYETSANLQVKAFRAGAKDFLIKPLIKTDFLNVVNSIYKKYMRKTSENSIGKVFTAISNRKGDGKSGFIINLAKELADISEDKVLLLDFNNSQDNISFLLNADIVHNTNYYINNLTQDNAQALLSTVTRYKNSSLYIMANSFIKNKSIAVKKDKLNEALNILKLHFKYILIDKTSDDISIEDELLVNMSDEIFCLVLPFISSFSKIKSILDIHYKDKKVKIILNQYTNEDNSKIEQIQSSLGREIFWKIPKNYTASNNSVNSNATLKEVADGTDIVNAYIELAKNIINRD